MIPLSLENLMLFKLYPLLLLIASSTLTCEPLILDAKFCIYALVARGSLCYSFAIVCLFLCAFVQEVLT